MTRYQWTVLFAAWVGWGFDIFDALLFNYVAPNCVPTLLGVPLNTPEARQVTAEWTGLLTSLMLLGWAAGGIGFGVLADRIGRTRTLLFTIVLYSLGTALCAASPNLAFLCFFRVLASLGIGGEWAAGAAMVAEVVPERWRLQAGAILYTAAPVGIVLASRVNYAIAGELFKGDPANSWRWVFLCGLLPSIAALAMRMFLHEPERWTERKLKIAAGEAVEKVPGLGALWADPDLRRRTISGLTMATVALLSWWSVNAFLPMIAGGLAGEHHAGMAPDLLNQQREMWKTRSMDYFSIGGFIGTLLTVPMATVMGRRTMFGLYYLASGAAIMSTFGLDVTAPVRVQMFFLLGLTVFGVFGSFTYYLPELFPTAMRATGSGFCYNLGRIITAAGPAFVGWVASRGGHQNAMSVLFWAGCIPLAGLLLLPLVVETKGQALEE